MGLTHILFLVQRSQMISFEQHDNDTDPLGLCRF